MRVTIIQHVAFEEPSGLLPHLTEANDVVSICRLDLGDAIPDLDSFDWLIVLGGPMSVHDEERYRWLAPEKCLIRTAINAGKVVFGICLGSQLIADALGSRVYPNEHQEIGWFPIHRTVEAEQCPLGRVFPATTHSFHWHGDTFDLPSGAVLLASSLGCLNQAFAIGDKILGVQFHPEITSESLAAMIRGCDEVTAQGLYIQSPAEFFSHSEQFTISQKLIGDIILTLRNQAEQE
jgi:GMP synthase (glutamine-hydrolysing)